MKGEQIPFLARIFAIIDAFDVMTHDKVYRTALSTEQALKEMENCSGGQFDPYLLQVFLRLQKMDAE